MTSIKGIAEASVDASLRSPDGVCGGYRLVEHIGSGGMGEIYRARSLTDPHAPDVAIKRLLAEMATDPLFIGMFLDEARLVQKLEHPNICRVHHFGQDGAHYFLVMDLVDGASLKQLLEASLPDGGLHPAFVASIVSDVARALAYAHTLVEPFAGPLNIVHRDVNPANIMVDREGTVRLVDFGLAKAKTQMHKTRPGYVKGKFGYLAPEQLRGEVDARTDVFSLGLCFYEGLTRTQLFNQPTAAATIQAITNYAGPPSVRVTNPNIPPALDAVVRRALARNPSDRFSSAQEMHTVLERVLAESQTRMSEAAMGSIVQSYFPDGRTSLSPAQSAQVDEVAASFQRKKLLRTYALIGAAVFFLATLATVLVMSLV
ncbi:MAG: serine/threonine-protein kinase [Myxococcota bacterium]